MSTREMIDKEVASLPEALQREVYDFVRFLWLKDADEHFNGLVLSEGELRVRLDEYRDALLPIKCGEQSWPEVNAWRLRLHKQFDEAFASTHLPQGSDYAWANEFSLRARRQMVASNP